MRKHESKPKALTYVLIPETSEIGVPMYKRLSSIIAEHHEDLARTNVRVALAWATSWKPDVDGRLVLGKCKKASELDRQLHSWDFVILLNREFWLDARVNDLQRNALLDHELTHAAVQYDDVGEPKVDERGRTVYRIRRHDLEEFSDIAARYGCYKRDIEQFAEALARAGRTGGRWVGYTALQDVLKDVGIEIDAQTLATFADRDRREILEWAEVHKGADARAVRPEFLPTMPTCLSDALGLLPESAAPPH